jgi:hydrogenase maturation protein HypF
MRIEGQSYRLIMEGLVQGVGFRPFLYQFAQAHQLQGWVMNTGGGLTMEIHGIDRASLDLLVTSMRHGMPGGARLDRIVIEETMGQKVQGFAIRDSQAQDITTSIPLDMAPCSDCLAELMDPHNRRYQYPFISCSSCGPRFTILDRLPFDRTNTTLIHFPLCRQCLQEYADVNDRRFHAQTISCPACGPVLTFQYPWQQASGTGKEALDKAAALLREGGILALKGVGGYQLAALASDSRAIATLRNRKKRPEKPLAVMFPDLDSVAKECILSEQERTMLCEGAAPIVLLARRNANRLSEQVSFDLPLYGAMLPSSPLHWLLLQELRLPLVMTSANFPGTPIVMDENIELLQALSDGGLIHNRPIAHRADDSVLRVMAGEAVAFRRGRGLAPYTLDLPGSHGMRLALGGEEKNTFTLQKAERLTVSQHIGHLGNRETSDFWEEEIAAFCRLLQVQADLVLHDRHPDYFATQRASALAAKTASVPHHQAHVFSCLAEHHIQEKALALAWDGAGLGEDETIWGGEGFCWNPETGDLQRIASWFPFPLIGGDRVAREPRRSALGLAQALGDSDLDPLFLKPFSEFDALTLRCLMQNPQRFPQTSSVARFFDAVASLLNLRHACSFEGQAALLLEGLTDPSESFAPFAVTLLAHQNVWLWDWRPMLREILAAIGDRLPASTISTRFHQSLVAAAESLLEKTGLQQLIVSGGVFQNRFLLETFKKRATQRGYQVWHSRRVPPNDAGLSLGQMIWINQRGNMPCA